MLFNKWNQGVFFIAPKKKRNSFEIPCIYSRYVHISLQFKDNSNTQHILLIKFFVVRVRGFSNIQSEKFYNGDLPLI